MNILGVKIDNLSITETLNKIEGFLKDGYQHYIVTPNPEIVLAAQNDTQLMKILNEADLAISDGIGLVWASNFLCQPLKERVTGADVINQICVRLAFAPYRLFLLGGKNGVALKAAAKLKDCQPDLKIEAEEDIYKAIEKINYFKPDILFVALGAPKQEKWIYYNLKDLSSVKLAIGVGGAFDFIAGRLKRAPAFLQKAGLEWLWRLAIEPWRIGRIYNAVVRFPMRVIKNKFFEV